MANTYTQLNIHTVFAVGERACIISRELGDRLHSYMAGILKQHKCYPLAINGFRDHVHLFFELNTAKSVSEIVREVKRLSTEWINEHHFVPAHFCWQEGYSAFSYSRSQRRNVITYIEKQEEHHQQTSFKDEYLRFLKQFQIEYDERYIFRWIMERSEK
ncbi:MAG: IS200/IS605 family transposase [Thermoguttaceae bacterium]